MDLERQRRVFDATVETMRAMLFRKGDDYATDGDRLSNFKLAGAVCGMDAERNCLNLIATKVARLGVLLNASGPPANESIDDTLIDLANYAVLLRMIRLDK